MVAARKHGSSGGTSRGGSIAKRRNAARTDKDGDLMMDSSSRGRGGISKSGGASASQRGRGSRASRPAVNTARLEREVKKNVTNGDARTSAPRGLEELRITGWANSKAASSNDNGVSSLIAWLEKRATMKSPTKRPVKIKKSRVDDQELIISVPEVDVGALVRLDGFVFAGANISIKRLTTDDSGPDSKESTVAMLKAVLTRRYNADLKLLDLSALGADPDLKASAIFDSRSTTSKFFPALMKILDQQFDTPAKKHEAIQSVSLANNELPNVSAVTTLAPTLPRLKNLDLSSNTISKMSDLSSWRRKFGDLDHLVISNNPIEKEEPDFAKTLALWYPRLRIVNTIQIRSDEDAARTATSQAVDLPFPIRIPSFQDEGQIAENFIRTFFAGFDTDRSALVNLYYDDQSEFSFQVNTSAPRDPSGEAQTAPQDWAEYIKRSRNLKKIQQLPARQSRRYRGAQAIAECMTSFPPTRHPDLAAEANKWLIECQLQSGLPDITGQSSGGVDGFLITIHGEYDEIDPANNNQSKKKRSFDRSFIIGPGGSSGVRIVSDMLCTRAYGGVQAFQPDSNDAAVVANSGAATQTAAPGLPNGLTPETAEQMVVELQKQTNMTVGYAKDCLEQVAWDFGKALEAFASVRANLPADAFVQQQ